MQDKFSKVFTKLVGYWDRMNRIDWNKFRLNPDYQNAFEELCYCLFCRKFKLYNGITTYHNQPGIESEPVKLENGKYYGFQSKFFDNTIDGKQIEKSITKAVNTYGYLDVILIYLNKAPGRDNKYQGKIEEIAKKKNVNIEWITPKQIELEVLNNLDLASAYFYLEDVGGFLGKNLDIKNVTQVKAAEHLDLSFLDSSEEIVEFSHLFDDIISTNDSTIFCLRGGAGSGKTLLLTKLALHLQPNLDLISEKIKLPVLIRLRDCDNKGLEEYIFHKKQEYNINTQGNFQFIYLLDGLDELDDQKCIEVLNNIHSIYQKEDTKCIVISSRESSSNLILLRNHFDNIKYIKINQIIYSDIENYFNKKNNPKKIELLKNFDEETLTNTIKDVLLLTLFWEEIENIRLNNFLSTFLFENVTERILTNPNHNSYLNNLNLPCPKKKQLIRINEEISWHLTLESKLKIRLDEMQNCVIDLFSKLSYKDTDLILNYIISCFFNKVDEGYEYRHRRYQEYFFMRKLKSAFESDFKVLRDTNILLNFDFMNNLFVPYLKRSYLDSNDVNFYLRVKSLESYYNKHWAGEGGEYLVNGMNTIAEFLSNLNERDFKYQMSEDNPLLLNKLIESCENLNPELIEIFYSNGKEEYAKYLLCKLSTQLEELKEKIQTSESHENYELNELYQKKNKVEWKTNVELSLHTDSQSLENLLKILRDASKENMYHSDEKIYKCFFDTVFRVKKHLCFKLFKQLERNEIKVFLLCLAHVNNLSILYEQENLRGEIIQYVKEVTPEIDLQGEENVLIWFYRCLLDLPIKNYEDIKPIIEKHMNEIITKRPIDIFNPYSNYVPTYCQLAFISNTQDQIKNQKYISALKAYSLLFNNFVELLKGKTTFRKIIFSFSNLEIKDSYYFYVNKEFKSLVTLILANSFLKTKEIENPVLIKRKIFENNYIDKFSFYLHLFTKDAKFANLIIDVKDLDELSLEISKYRDYNDILENNLRLAKLYLPFSFDKAILHFKKGINDSLVRYGWRKDVFLNQAVNSLDLLIQNNWLSDYEIENNAEKILLMSKEVLNHIDGKGTRWAPNILIKKISNINLELAYNLFNKYNEILLSDDTLGYILAKKANVSYPLYEIEANLQSINPEFMYDGKIREDYFVNRLKVFFEIAKNESYGDSIQKEYFEKSYAEIDNCKKNLIGTSDYETYLKSILDEYEKLCDKYGFDNNLQMIIKKDTETTSDEVKNEADSLDIIHKINEIGSKEEFIEHFKKSTEDAGCMCNEEYLKKLVSKSLELCKDIDIITDYLERRHYSLYYWNKNSEWDYLLVKNIFDNQEAKKLYLERSFHSNRLISYPAIIEVFVALGSKDKSINLFNDYLYFCEFLIT